MVFWILVAGLVAGVTLAITWPLTVAPASSRDDEAADVAVYRDQLEEIAADAARGALAPEEAEAARTEIARRLLRVSHAKSKPASSSASEWRRLAFPVYAITAVTLPLASLALYLVYGAPGLPGQPLDERLARPISVDRPDDLVAKVEARLRDHPDDGTGWDVIAPVYYAMGRYGDAATAYANALRILGETQPRLQGLANARIRAENGIVPDDARRALERVLVLAPKSIEPRIWLALAKEQDGRLDEAAGDYKQLLAEAPADAPWRKVIEERLQGLAQEANTARADTQVGGQGGASGAGAPAQSGATPDAAAVATMSPQEQQAFIARMVDGLAARLKADGSDAAGWVKLIRAYQVLGRRDDAVKALSDARSSLKGDQVGLARVEDLARQLGLGS